MQKRRKWNLKQVTNKHYMCVCACVFVCVFMCMRVRVSFSISGYSLNGSWCLSIIFTCVSNCVTGIESSVGHGWIRSKVQTHNCTIGKYKVERCGFHSAVSSAGRHIRECRLIRQAVHLYISKHFIKTLLYQSFSCRYYILTLNHYSLKRILNWTKVNDKKIMVFVNNIYLCQ